MFRSATVLVGSAGAATIHRAAVFTEYGVDTGCVDLTLTGRTTSLVAVARAASIRRGTAFVAIVGTFLTAVLTRSRTTFCVTLDATVCSTRLHVVRVAPCFLLLALFLVLLILFVFLGFPGDM